jgi:site-specific recombinase XerD
VSTEKFIEERKYLKGVTDKTLAWYRDSFRAFHGALESEDQVKRRIVELRQRGLKPVSINTYMRCVRAYFEWLGTPLKVTALREEQKIIAAFSADQVSRLIRWKPAGGTQARLHVLALTALDTGLRVSELLGLRRMDVDLDNLMIRVVGKGNKHRLVPLSVELWKVLYRYMSQHTTDRIFAARHGGPIGTRNLLRDFKVLCKRIGITGVRTSFHTLRHTFAVNYLRAGGNVLYLQRILGHSSLEMTNRYCRSLGIEDLKAVHSGLSLLSR